MIKSICKTARYQQKPSIKYLEISDACTIKEEPSTLLMAKNMQNINSTDLAVLKKLVGRLREKKD